MAKFLKLKSDKTGVEEHGTTDDFGTVGGLAVTQGSIGTLDAAMNANSQAMTNVNIDSGAIDGVTIATSDVTVGTGKTLDVSDGTLTLANDQISGDKVEGGTIASITISALAGAMNAASQSMTNVNIDSGTIDGVTLATSNVTVGAGKTLDVSAGTLTLANDQISGDKIQGGTIGSITIGQLLGALDANSQEMTNVNIDSGTINGVTVAESDVTVGSGKTLNVSDGTLTTSAAQKKAIIEGANSDLDVGAFDLRASTLTADSLSSGQVVFTGTDGVLSAESGFAYNASTDTLTVANLTVSGTTTTVNSTVVTIKDPLLELGDDTSSTDNLDRGLKMKYNADGSAKIAFMGFDKSDSKFVVISDAVDSSSLMSGTPGTLKASLEGSADVSSGSLTTSAAQKKAIIEGAGSDLDVGAFDLRAQTLTADSLTSGRVVFAGADGVLSDDSDMSFSEDTLTVTKLGAFEAAGAINFASQAMTNVNIDSGTVDGCDVTVGTGKTLNVSGGTLTTSTAQDLAVLKSGVGANDANLDFGAFDVRAQTLTADGLTAGRVVFAGTNGVLSDDSDMSFSGDTLTVTKLGAFTAAGAINFASQAMTNVDINSGSIDGATIATSDITVGTDKTLDVSDGTLTLANDQISGDKVEGGTIAEITISKLAGAMDCNSSSMTNVNIDSGAIDGTNVTVGSGKTLDVSAGTLTLANDQISGDKINGGTIGSITIAQLAGAMDANSQALTNVNIDSGTINGVTVAESDVTVGTGKTLNVSSGTLTTSAAQKKAIIEGASSDLDVGDFDLRAKTLTADDLTATRVVFAGADGVLSDDSDLTFSGDTLTATKIGAFEAAGAINFGSQAMTNVNIDSGDIDGTRVGYASASSGCFTTLDASGATALSSTLAVTGLSTFTTHLLPASDSSADIGGSSTVAQWSQTISSGSTTDLEVQFSSSSDVSDVPASDVTHYKVGYSGDFIAIGSGSVTDISSGSTYKYRFVAPSAISYEAYPSVQFKKEGDSGQYLQLTFSSSQTVTAGSTTVQLSSGGDAVAISSVSTSGLPANTYRITLASAQVKPTLSEWNPTIQNGSSYSYPSSSELYTDSGFSSAAGYSATIQSGGASPSAVFYQAGGDATYMFFRDMYVGSALRLKELSSAPSIKDPGTDSMFFAMEADSKSELHWQGSNDSSALQITSGGKIDAGALEFASTSALQDNSGLDLKSSLAGDGLTLTAQVLDIDAAQTNTITSITPADGNLSLGKDAQGTVTVQNILQVDGNLNIAGDLMVTGSIDSVTTTATELRVEDLDVTMASRSSESSFSSPADKSTYRALDLDASLQVERNWGDADHPARLLWDESNHKWYQDRRDGGSGDDANPVVIPVNTAELDEGSTNLYFTNTRARGAISVTDAGGDGSMAYNSSTGVLTYTGPSAAEVRAHLSAGTGVTFSSGQISIGQAVGTSDAVQFASVQTASIKPSSSKTLTVPDVDGDSFALLAESQTFTNKTLTSPDINGGSIDGATIATSNITVGAGKTLDVSGGTLTLAADQISGDSINGGTIGSITISQLAGAMDCNDKSMTNVNVDGGAIDGTPVGAESASTGAFTTLSVSGLLTLSESLKVSKDMEIGFSGWTASSMSTNGLAYINAADSLAYADADAAEKGRVIGIWDAADSKLVADGPCDCVFDGSANAGDPLYLSSDAGKVTATPPSGSGDVVLRVGFAMENGSDGAASRVFLKIGEPIVLS